MYYKVYGVTYLYSDQYRKLVFLVPKECDYIKDLYKIVKEKYDTISPIYQKDEKSDFQVRFGDYKHYFKERVQYDIIFSIHKNENKNTNKTYVNLYIEEMNTCERRILPKTRMEDL
jgi:hypothetical protein